MQLKWNILIGNLIIFIFIFFKSIVAISCLLTKYDILELKIQTKAWTNNKNNEKKRNALLWGHNYVCSTHLLELYNKIVQLFIHFHEDNHNQTIWKAEQTIADTLSNKLFYDLAFNVDDTEKSTNST